MPVSLEVEAKEWENVIYRVGQTEAPFMSLASKGLRTCPTLIGNCGTLRILDLSFNSLMHLPGSIGELRLLEVREPVPR